MFQWGCYVSESSLLHDNDDKPTSLALGGGLLDAGDDEDAVGMWSMGRDDGLSQLADAPIFVDTSNVASSTSTAATKKVDESAQEASKKYS